MQRKAVSGRSARVQDSIDKIDGLGYFLLPTHAYLLLRRDVNGSLSAVAELPQHGADAADSDASASAPAPSQESQQSQDSKSTHG